MKEETDDDIPFLLHVIIFPVQLALIILYIVFTLLTLGIFLPEESEGKEKGKRQISSQEERLRINLQRKRNRLIKVRQRGDELQQIVSKIRNTERWVFFFVRMIIAALLVFVNGLYLSSQEIESISIMRKCLPECIEMITNFNALILLFYGLPAYILYGTADRFTKAMKAKAISILRRKHIPTISEFQSIRKEEQDLMKDIEHLKRLLEQFG